MKYNISEYIIRAYISDGEIFLKGRKDFEDSNVTDLKIIDFENKIISSEVLGERGKKYFVKIFFDEKLNIEKSICTCCKDKCRHTTSTLFALLNSKNLEKNLQKAETTDNILKKLINDFSEFNLINDNFKFNKIVSIKPIFKIIEENKCSVNFLIGKNIFYPIQNFEEFLEIFKKNQNYYVKKNISFFCGEIKNNHLKYIRFMEKQIENFYDFFDKRKVKFIDEDFILSRQSVDDFFDLVCGEEITCKLCFSGENKVFNVLFCDLDLDFFLDIENINGNVKITNKNLDVEFFEGLDFGYIIKDNFVYKVLKEKYQLIKKFNEIFLIMNKNEITFYDDDEIKLFIDNFVPILEKNNIIKNFDTIFNIEKPTVEFYLEYEKNKIFLKTKYSYSEFSNMQRVFQYQVQDTILQIGFQYDFPNNFFMKDDEDIFALFSGNIEKLSNLGQVFLSEDLKSRKIKIYKDVIKEVRIKADLLEINFDLSDIDFNEISEILKAYKIKKKFFKLKNGDFIDLSKSELKPMLEVIDDFDISEKEIVGKDSLFMPIYNAFYLNSIITKGKQKVKTNDIYDEIINKFSKVSENEKLIPDSLKDTLREYQKKGFSWLKAISSLNFGGILADDMGLGKTLQVISVILSEKENRPSIVVCPTSLIYNWKNEFEKFAPNIDVLVVFGNPANRSNMLENQKFTGVFITTYDVLKRDIKNYEKFNFKYIIIDEAQNIKNAFTQNAKVVKMLKGDVRFALTGTPIENSLSEIWSIFDFIMPGYLGTKKKFHSNFEVPIIKYNDQTSAFKLKKKILPFILRRVKKDVLKELPEKSEMTLYCEMSTEQRKLYNASFIEAKNEIEKVISDGDFEKEQFKILAYITRLRQLCCHPALFIQNYFGGSGKLELAIETIKNVLENGHRILLFSQFTSMLNIIKDELIKEGITLFYLDGKTSSEKRLEMTEKFNNGENDVFLISLKAGGTGLNLTGADVVIHFDPWWNPAVMEQASDRAYRFGQLKNVQVFYIVTKDSIEEKIITLQNRKKELTKSIISDDGEIIIGKMTKDDILNIFHND